ncbi:ATP-dependent nuclease subunit B [Lactococcus termiticola]|uniref:ATP-dependent helicase/nuclease subunit B n=1 Tax=Lactococcus termiticola TaxID=2169526 RepID=A0A2R5HFU4_9LACT|nr:ATP-dependent nuclease subunit B [Lactococcus termiticola]GBG96884.1 ATP-dependent helicase/nuclease subunit B [Lactococcus termiticola]
MQIIYSEINQDLSGELLNKARSLMAEGKKVYYIVPSSMSFEKEKSILERLGEGEDTAVFDLLVTRFKQLPYYFDRNISDQEAVELSQVGFSMLFRKVLKDFSQEEIPLYYSLQASPSFLDMLVNLREEFLRGNLSPEDLAGTAKFDELSRILTAFEEALSQDYHNFSDFQLLTAKIAGNEGQIVQQLKNTVFIIDGYSRFSAEEEAFIDAINGKVDDLIIGTYASQTDYKAGQFVNSVYSDALEMMESFRQKFRADLLYLDSSEVNEVYSKLTDIVKEENSYSIPEQLTSLSEKDAEQVEIWSAENQMAEIEAVAKAIRQEIVAGRKFKDMLVLVGDPTAYEIPVKQIFELYDIPYFYAKEESMANHPLIAFLESLYAIKKKNYRFEDLINLLKSGLYGQISQDEIDAFDLYVSSYNIQGRKKFTDAFTLYKEEFFAFDDVELVRERYFSQDSALQNFLNQTGKKTGRHWLSSLDQFFKDSELLINFNGLYQEALEKSQQNLASKHEQVWKLLNKNFEEFQSIFSDEKMSISDFLDIIIIGFKNANYRQIPANVDVVNVNDYALVEPAAADIVYAIGLNQSNFPRIRKNNSLLTDEERLVINEASEEGRFLEAVESLNYSKNLTSSLSLVNAAHQKLILSSPEIFDNEQDETSNLLKVIVDRDKSGKILKRMRRTNPEESISHIANQRAMISALGEIERQLATTGIEKKEVFWGSIFRLISKNNPKFQDLLLSLDRDIDTVNLSEDTVKELYNDKINVSVSSFENFYNCEYQYFLQNTLRLQAVEPLSLDSRIVGNFFHEVFEKLMADPELSEGRFDESLGQLLNETYSNYELYFEQDARSRFAATNLKEIVQQTSVMLKEIIANPDFSTLSTEASFGIGAKELGNFELSYLRLRGRIDRIDNFFDDGLVAVDYKSSRHDFDLQSAYDKKSLQLLTYLDVLKKNYPEQKIWGALYLQIKNEALNLSKINHISEIDGMLKDQMKYQGLSLQENQPDFVKIQKNNKFTEDDLDKLLKMNEGHFEEGARTLKSGEIKINPVREKGKPSLSGCQYCKLKSICRIEANRHLKEHSREIKLKSNKEIKAELEKA